MPSLPWNSFRNPLIVRPLFFVGDGLVPSRAGFSVAASETGRDKPVPYGPSTRHGEAFFGGG